MSKFCTEIKETYQLKDGTKTVWELVETRENELNELGYRNCIDACKFFRRLGGSEYCEKSYTSQGYLVTRLVSRSPDRLTKIVRHFTFR